MGMLDSKSLGVNAEKTLYEMGCKSKGRDDTQVTDSDCYTQKL